MIGNKDLIEEVVLPPRPQWNAEDRDLWLEVYMTTLPTLLESVSPWDNDERLILEEDMEKAYVARTVSAAKVADQALLELQMRNWDRKKPARKRRRRTNGKR